MTRFYINFSGFIYTYIKMPPYSPQIGDWLLAIPAHPRLFPSPAAPREPIAAAISNFITAARRICFRLRPAVVRSSLLFSTFIYTGNRIVQWVNNGRLSVRSLPFSSFIFFLFYPGGDRRRQNERVRWPSLVPLLEMLKHGQPTRRSRFDGNDQTTFTYFDCRYVY